MKSKTKQIRLDPRETAARLASTRASDALYEKICVAAAYQAQAWGGGMDGQRKLYEENKRQTEYLRRLVDLMGSSSALFV